MKLGEEEGGDTGFDAQKVDGKVCTGTHSPLQVTFPPSSPAAYHPTGRNGANSFRRILNYADRFDKLLMLVGCLGAVVDGASPPVLLIIVSSIVDAFGRGETPQSFMASMSKYSLHIVYVGLVAGCACFLEGATWIKTGERQASRLRFLFLKSLLRQEESFYDLQGGNGADVVNSMAADTFTIQDVIGEKVPHFAKNISTFIACYIVGFYLASRLAAVSLAFTPFLVIPGLLYGRTLAGLALQMQAQYRHAGVVAEQAITSVRTLYACVSEERALQEYSCRLAATVKLGLKEGLAKGLAVGSNGVVYAIWAFLSWYGNQLVMMQGVSGGRVIVAGISTITGGLALGTSLPDLKHIFEAAVAGARICDLIERVPRIDPEDSNGLLVEADKVKAGKTTALVGGSGSGKSTIISLLLRFYDPSQGCVSLDGIDIKLLQLKSLRSQMGLVSQEPALFATTIKHNILIGKEDASAEDIIKAAKQANAHNFISQLPDGYDTLVGECGILMSGGQKQRIAIARAMLKNPPILLLDEATSALDAESEKAVQAALDHAVLGRTTLIISHHLSSIRNAHVIAVLYNGRITELGKHEELLKRENGAYAALISAAAANAATPDGINKSKTVSYLQTCASDGWRSDCHSVGEISHEDKNGASNISSRAPSFTRIIALNKPEWWLGIKGTVGASVSGVIQPLYAFTIGSIIPTYYSADHEEQQHSIRNYCMSFAALALASVLASVMQHYSFAAMGEIMTKRVREKMLANILRFEVGWFDRPENSSAAIGSQLASEAKMVRALVGDRWSLVVSTLVAAITAATLGLLISWRLAIVILAVQPLVIICYYVRRVLIRNISVEALRMQQQSSHLAAEAMTHHRIVAAFHSHNTLLSLFNLLQDQAGRAAWRQAWLGGAGLGSAQLMTHFILALSYWYGAHLHSQGVLGIGAMFTTLFILVSTGRVIAEAGSMTPDIAKGAAAVASIFSLLDRRTLIDPDDMVATRLQKVSGHVELRRVSFAYPSRPRALVLSSLSLRVPAGRSAALVGRSGSGKSTVISLILRFYDPLSGTVSIDGHDVRKLHLRTLRQHIGLVSQDPCLFSGSIRYNITHAHQLATEEEMVEAAKAANAHDFICSLEKGYDTDVGYGGAQLSGGQKQRIAIARAIVKRPAILLLDEATSALDVQSEKVVQKAIINVMENRTTIMVAHRLSTVHTCDTIYVLEDGTLVESGSHAQLLAKGPTGSYFNLVHLQNRAV
ncbi:hypothetical protein KP509_18G013800 [Ceratopteris richardii]|uniref:Uncharacterized protein n=1 Tax=Ceratopteris richardii TaxID=49495 RepID=A0A8T2SNG7_CERRI|nr:hypothetical protein KP509_18G013800 [Ceratopteris richardii]